MDLDALGLNSTFESSELQASYEPPVDRVDTSEIEGPEDFTMNMTYWMTADLPLAQIKSRKEAKGRAQQQRMNAMQEEDAAQHETEEGDQAVVEDDMTEPRPAPSNSASPTRRAKGTTDERTYSTPASERSMEHEEKVKSFLSGLPDTDMEGAISGTPPHMLKQSFLQIPRSSPPKARSLQPTVEDYDTPRKPTQETVIHHTAAAIETREHDELRDHIAQLQSRIDQQELASKTRITELETILSYTRSDLEHARTDNYRQKEKVASLEKIVSQQTQDADVARSSVEAQMRAKEEALDSKMHDFGEEMRSQNYNQLESQREDHERQIRAHEESKRLVDEQLESKKEALKQAQSDLSEARRQNEQQLEVLSKDRVQSKDESAANQHVELTEQLSSVQARAAELQAQLERATSEAQSMREETEKKETVWNATEAKVRARTAHISDLETNLQATRFELECAQADVAAKQQLFRTNLDLNARIRTLQSDLDVARSTLIAEDEQTSRSVELETSITALQHQLEVSRTETRAKDQETIRLLRTEEQHEQSLNTAHGRIEGLEATIVTLRQQLAEAHRDSARARTESERLERDLSDANDRLQEAQIEANRRVADVEQKLSKMKELRQEAEHSLRELQSQHDDLIEGHEAMMEDVRDKAEDAVRKVGALLDQERNEKKRIMKDLERTKDDLEKLRAEAAQKLTEDDESSDEESTVSSTTTNEKDVEISNLRVIIRKPSIPDPKSANSKTKSAASARRTLP
jgi:chromosome segregation ATPase